MSDTDQSDDMPEFARRIVTQRTYHSLIDQQWNKAVEDGLLNNLTGQGRPQAMDDDRLVPEEDRGAQRLLKANDLSLPWVEARRDLERQQAEVAQWLDAANARWERASDEQRLALRAEHADKLRSLRSAILNYNLRLPPGIPQLPLPHMQAEQARLGGQR